mmetsp:Transcript_116603/g.376405  ORF Transcript_116603/g.376405 Transcript_116603/m.376405 type:complete len:96 (-) Transcript_116603:57-344(-)
MASAVPRGMIPELGGTPVPSSPGQPVLEFPAAAEDGGGPGWLTLEGAALAMLLAGLCYCALRAFLTGIRQVTCLEPPAPMGVDPPVAVASRSKCE